MVMGSTHPGHNTQAEGPCPKKHRKRLDIDLKYTCSIRGNSYGSKATLYTHNKNKHTSRDTTTINGFHTLQRLDGVTCTRTPRPSLQSSTLVSLPGSHQDQCFMYMCVRAFHQIQEVRVPVPCMAHWRQCILACMYCPVSCIWYECMPNGCVYVYGR